MEIENTNFSHTEPQEDMPVHSVKAYDQMTQVNIMLIYSSRQQMGVPQKQSVLLQGILVGPLFMGGGTHVAYPIEENHNITSLSCFIIHVFLRNFNPLCQC